MYYVGHFVGSFGFAMLFGGTIADGFCGGICGLIVGLISKLMESLGSNQFFHIIAAAFPMAFAGYLMGEIGLAPSPDSVIIGALMLLVPGLLFTNAMRDIIFGDTNSGINRIVQVFLIAAAIALGTAAAWNLATILLGQPTGDNVCAYTLIEQLLPCFIGCVGFFIIFNIHGPGGFLCALGGALAWAVYSLAAKYTGNDILGYFWGAFFASGYSEAMARIRKYPAISYLVISIFPLIPGAGVYYTMRYAVQGNMEMFATKGMHTAAIAGAMAVGILLVSTAVRLFTNWKRRRK